MKEGENENFTLHKLLEAQLLKQISQKCIKEMPHFLCV